MRVTRGLLINLRYRLRRDLPSADNQAAVDLYRFLTKALIDHRGISKATEWAMWEAIIDEE